jgi:UDP-N-acetylglucosamine--dolichyl-phosphate N-acetylglucosaminephosphotransferase
MIIPYFNRFMISTGIIGRDIMKKDRPIVADMGGPGVMVGFLGGIFLYIGILSLLNAQTLNGEIPEIEQVLASLCTILIITLIGIFDTLTALMKRREGTTSFERYKKVGIPRWLYYFIPLPAAAPLMAVQAGVHTMSFPFIGAVDLSFYYPLVLVPLAVLCCSNATNFLAGFNGLEAGMGFILLISQGLYAYLYAEPWAAVIALTFAGGLLAFFRYNWYPAQVFPGDLNYTIGAVAACVAVVGNMEKFSILCFTPYIIEAVLKLLSKFEAENFGILQPDGTLRPRSEEIRGLTHIAMLIGRRKEWEISMILILFEATICIAAFLMMPYI